MELLRKLDVMAKHTEYSKTGRKRGFYALFSYSKFLLFSDLRKNKKKITLTFPMRLCHLQKHGWQVS